MIDPKVQELLKRYEEGLCTPEEKKAVEAWYSIHAALQPEPVGEDYQQLEKELQHRIPMPPGFGHLARRWAIAASVIIGIGVASWVYFHKAPVVQEPLVNDVAPGGNRATLTLSTGKRIVIDQLANGRIAQDGGVSISKSASGKIIYHAAGDQPERDYKMNTISTPRGGQIEVVLPDGSLAFMNSESTLTYPVQFEPNDRKVTVTGEVYFEVTKDGRRPFIVASLYQKIKVLGTHFNVNANNAKDPMKTTLAEGKVEITLSSTGQRTILAPGQQAIADPTSLKVIHVDPYDFTAWKDGIIVFKDTPLKEAIEQICRWYDVTADESLSASNGLPINAEISRKTPLSAVLHALSSGTGLNFYLKERRIYLTK
ncbi:FecR domain-containing protein [Chitinophaga sancti]|uniref:FecR domain-containing protein n=1 Tax=Chitinophaga sancti TaxID=1004 RepID=UPI002A765402|nr:FecR domain-containing protein [Chitinophaga sancti]WPQ61907.1 FecR domain-containing protein [Chitinophaga sancti]